MKNLIVCCVLFLVGGLSVQAQSPILPPESEQKTLYDFSQDPNCQENKNTETPKISRIHEVIIPTAFQSEMDRFYQTLNNIARDHQSHPDFLAEKGILELRRHTEYLREICFQAFQQCLSEDNFSFARVYEQGINWCNKKINELHEIAQAQITAATIQNQARKELSLQKQKWGGIDTRMRVYFHHWMTQFVNDFRTFVEKVFNFIRTPAS